MTRIIGGSAGGRRLRTPAGERTRPTADRVREALFSALESQRGNLVGAHVLDLYAGSGALGLEAASRGASVVVAVESDRRTAKLIGDNARELALSCRVVAQPVERWLAHGPAHESDERFDIVLADPPYPLENHDLQTVLGLLVNRLTEGATVVVERSARTPEPDWPVGLEPVRRRDYGETTLWYVRAAAPADASEEAS